MAEADPTTEKINCPYCGQPNTLESELCWACYKQLHIPKEARLESKTNRDLKRMAGPAGAATAPAEDAAEGSGKSPLAFWGRLALVCGLFFFYLQWIKDPDHYSFLDLVNLAFHEAGHIFLGFFGEFIKVSGGTIFQLLIPSACAGQFLRQENRLGWQLCLFWAGENFLNISSYAGDAIKQELPLVGGGCHDWTYLLTELHLIAHTEGTAKVIFSTGSLIIFTSLYLITRDAFKKTDP